MEEPLPVFAPIQVKEFASVDAMNAAMADLLRSEFERTETEPRAIMLSGGLTPLPVFERLAGMSVRTGSQVHVTYSDDRHVPTDSPQSNYGATLGLLRALELPEERVIRVHSELPLTEAADRFDTELRSFMERGGTFPLGLLGIGADGHTCSLFNEADLERSRGHYAIAVRKQTPPDRVSVTPELLRKLDHIVFMVAGREKDAVLERLLRAPDSVVAGQAVKYCRKVSLWRAF